MAELKDKIQNGLDENRILILGAQVLIGFQYRMVFEPGFAHFSVAWQYTLLVCLLVMVLGFGTLLMPTTYHRIVERGEDAPELLSFTNRIMRPALVAIVLSITLNILVNAHLVLRTAYAAVIAGVMALVGFGYLLELETKGHRKGEGSHMSQQEAKREPTPLKSKIRHVLTEARVVLPGAQALLGFQFVTMVMTDFDKLPASSKYIHLASLLLIALCTLLLMAPAARHRLVEKGEETPEFHRYASRMVLAAIVPLGLGITGDLFVVVRKISGSVPAALIVSIGILLVLFGVWFGLPLMQRARNEKRGGLPTLPPLSPLRHA